MKYEELPENMQKQIDELKHYAQTIQSDVLDALESAESMEEFRSQVDSSMDDIISKHRRYARFWAQGKGVLSMVKRDSPPILKEKWEYLDERTLDGHQIKVNGQEFFTFAAFGNLLFTPEEVEIARKRFMEWPNHQVTCPLWVLDRDDIIESASRLGLQTEEGDFNEVIKRMRARIADTIGDAWDETLDEEVEFVVNNRIAKEAIK